MIPTRTTYVAVALAVAGLSQDAFAGRKSLSSAAFAAGGAAAAAAAKTSTQTTLQGRVVGVKDGDTIVVLDAQKRTHDLRLADIDAPEACQAFGSRAKQHLSNLIYSKQVTVQILDVDKYRREVARIFLEGRDINLEQVRAGFAWYWRRSDARLGAQERVLYAQAAYEAQSARRGLWSDAQPVPPWDFRKGNGSCPKSSYR
jgi:endonuclease YncB( thermonuclease family)